MMTFLSDIVRSRRARRRDLRIRMLCIREQLREGNGAIEADHRPRGPVAGRA